MSPPDAEPDQDEAVVPIPSEQVSLRTMIREWTRIGCTGFGGPPAHIAMLRQLCVNDREWLSGEEFEDAIAATNLLPGPASTQLAIFCGWRLRGPVGAVVAGVCFIVPGLIIILMLSAVFLAAHPPQWISGAAAGAGASVPVVAIHAARGLIPASWRRAGSLVAPRARWIVYLAVGAAAAATVGQFLVLLLVVCGLVEVASRIPPHSSQGRRALFPLLAVPTVAIGGLAALVWVAFKVGALSYGGGFVIIPLMQHDAVHTYHWLTASQFLTAVALGQITPGPVVQTVAVVGYGAAGVVGGLLAALVAFAPSFVFVLVGGPRFDRIRSSGRVEAFLTGAGAAAIGAIAGSAIPLGLALDHLWQLGVLLAAATWLFGLRRGVVSVLAGAAALGVVVVLLGAPIG
jgi:chromate transporter